MRTALIVVGIILVVVALDLQPWQKRWRNPLLTLAGALVFLGLWLISPVVLAVAIPGGGLAAIIIDCLANRSHYFAKQKPEPVPAAAEPPADERQPIGFALAMRITAPAGRVSRMKEEGFAGEFLEPVQLVYAAEPETPNEPPAAPPQVNAQYTPDAIVDGRLMVLRRDGQMPPPVGGSNR